MIFLAAVRPRRGRDRSIIWNKGSATLVDPVHVRDRDRRAAASSAAAASRGSRTRRSRAGRTRPTCGRSPASCSAARGEVGARVRCASLFVGCAHRAAVLARASSDTNLAAAVAIYAIIAISLVLLTGWAGEISLGQVAFVAIGSAAAGAANVHWQLDPFLSFLLAGGVGAVASVIIGLPALRIRGLMLAVTTLAFAVATSSFLLEPRPELRSASRSTTCPTTSSTASRASRSGRRSATSTSCRRRPRDAVLLRVLVGARSSCCSRCAGCSGRETCATSSRIRENERNAQAFRLSPTRAKLLAFALSGFFASFAGGLLVLHQQALGEDDLRPGREHPRAHDGRGRRARIGAGRHPRRGLHQEHRVVQRRRAAAATGSCSRSPAAASG